MLIDDLWDVPLKDIMNEYCIVYSPECGYYYGVTTWDEALQMEEEFPEMCDLEWRKGKKEFHYPRFEEKTIDYIWEGRIFNGDKINQRIKVTSIYSLNDVDIRIREFLSDPEVRASTRGKNVLVVTHKTSGRILLRAAGHKPAGHFRDIPLQNAINIFGRSK